MIKYKERHFKDWDKAKIHLSKLPHNWIFRGQGKKKWSLRDSFERCSFGNHHVNIELSFMEEFKRGALSYLKKENIPKTLAEWISLMQHYGAPTRFLDFTASPYIAAYFALEEDYNLDSAIWAIDSQFYREKSGELFFDKFSEKIENGKIHFVDVLPDLVNNNTITCAFPIEPYLQNKRFNVQQGVFMCKGSTINTFEENLDFVDNTKNHIRKITLSKSLRGDALYDLNKMNINRESLFFNLEGFSKQLTNYFTTLISYGTPFKQMREFENSQNN